MAHLIKCKKCGENVEYSSSSIGTKITCTKCGHQFLLTVPEEVENPTVYNFPKKINIQLVDKESNILRIPNVIVVLKKGVFLGPFFTNEDGRVEITKNEYENAKADELSADLWGSKYRNQDQIGSLTVQVMSEEEIDEFVKAREANWKVLFTNEKNMWSSFEEFISAVQNHSNKKVFPVVESIKLDNVNPSDVLDIKIKSEIRE